ncbi:hypothetical protein GCM10027418_06320 [Mariniluteicoccus endophyticus]
MAEDQISQDPDEERPAATPRHVTKKVQFYRLAFHWRKSASRTPPVVDWRALIDSKNGIFGFGTDVKYEVEGSGEGAVLLGRPVHSDDFRLRSDAGTFQPLEQETAENYLARINVAAFFNCNAFVMLGAAVGAPNSGAVASLANYLNPQKDGEWVASALTSAPDLERFRAATELSKLHITTDVLPPGLGLDVEPQTLGEAMGHVSDLVNAELSVELRIRVKRPSKNPDGMRNLKGLANGLDRRRLKKLHAYSLDPQVGDQVMDLLNHNMVMSVEIAGTAGPEAALEAVRNVRDERNDEVAELVRRIESEG